MSKSPTLPKTPEYVNQTYERNGKTHKKRVYNHNSPVGKKILEIWAKEDEILKLQQEVLKEKEELLVIAQQFNLSRIEVPNGPGYNRKRDTKWRYDRHTVEKIRRFHEDLNALQLSGRATGQTRFYLAR